SAILIWDLGGRPGTARGPRRPPGPEDLEGLWRDLAGPDAARAYRALGDLVLAGDAGVAFLKTRLSPVPPLEPEVARRVAGLVADLGSDAFKVRQRAAAELEKLAGAAAPALRKVLAGDPALEVRRRVEKLLAGVEGKEAVHELRRQRAVEALER